MTIIKSPSAKGRNHSELSILKFHLWLLGLFCLSFIPHKVNLGKLPTYFAKQSQFQNAPVNANPLITKAYENRNPNRTSKQTQFKPNKQCTPRGVLPIKQCTPRGVLPVKQCTPRGTPQFKPNKQCTPRGTPRSKPNKLSFQSNAFSGNANDLKINSLLRPVEPFLILDCKIEPAHKTITGTKAKK